MEKGGYYLVLWRVDDIPYHKKAENLFNELHNPKILSLAEVVGAVELQTSQRPGKILDDWKPEIIRLLGGVGSISGLTDIGILEEETALTKALVEQKDDYSTISISAFTILLKNAVGGLPERFTRKVYRELQARSLPALSSFVEGIEAVERGRADAERPFLLFDDGGEDRTETAERAAGGADCSGTDKKKTKTGLVPTSEDNKRIDQIKKYIKNDEFKQVSNQYVKDIDHFKKAKGSLMSALSKSLTEKTCYYEPYGGNYLIGITVYREKKYYWVKSTSGKRGSYWYLNLG